MAEEKLLKRLEAMLRKTVENGATEEEATSAAMIAQKMMIEHGLTMPDIETVKIASEDVPVVSQEVDEETIKEVSNRSAWKDVLINTIADINRCLCYWENEYDYMRGTRRKVQVRKMRLIGTEYNRFATLQIYNWLETQIEELSKEALYDVQRRLRMKELFLPGGLKPREYTASWKQGCAQRICVRLQSTLTDLITKDTETTFAIVVAETVEQQKENVKAFTKKKGLKLVSERFMSKRGTGYNDGYRDGGDVDISPSKAFK